jgi:hypothetical protein
MHELMANFRCLAVGFGKLPVNKLIKKGLE